MSETLILLLGEAPDRPIRWGLAADAGARECGVLENAAAIASIAEIARGAQSIVALLPGEQVASRIVPSAPRGERARLAAAGLLLEDELAEARGALRVAVAESGGVTITFAAKAQLIDSWLAALKAAGVDCDCLSADYLALPRAIGETLILVDGDRAVCAHGAVGFAVEMELFLALKDTLFAEPPSILRIIGEEARLGEPPAGVAVDWLGPAAERRLFETYAASIAAAPTPNFLPKRIFRRKAIAASVGPWRRAAGLAAGLALAGIAALIADGALASRDAARWTAATQAVHAAAFPEAAAEDPAAHARRRLAGGGAGASFLLLASRLNAALGAGDALRIDRIRFDAARGDFAVSLESKSDAEIGALKSRLLESGLASEDLGGFRRSGDAWVGEVRVSLR
jgi:type II secretion system protein L